MIDPQTKFVQSDKVSHADVRDEMILLHFERGEYFGLNPIGREIWSILSTPHTQEEIIGRMIDVYDIDETTLRTDVEKLLIELHQNGIIEADEASPRAEL